MIISAIFRKYWPLLLVIRIGYPSRNRQISSKLSAIGQATSTLYNHSFTNNSSTNCYSLKNIPWSTRNFCSAYPLSLPTFPYPSNKSNKSYQKSTKGKNSFWCKPTWCRPKTSVTPLWRWSSMDPSVQEGTCSASKCCSYGARRSISTTRTSISNGRKLNSILTLIIITPEITIDQA